MEYHVYWLLKGSCFKFFGDENVAFFELFGDEKYGLFLGQKVDGKIFTDYGKVLVLNF